MWLIRLVKVILLGVSLALILASCATRFPNTRFATVNIQYSRETKYAETRVELHVQWIDELMGQSPPAQGAESKYGFLVEVPEGWKSLTNTGVFTTTEGVTGTILIRDVGSFAPPSRGPIVTDPGYKAIVVYTAGDVPRQDFDILFKFEPGRFTATCFVLKAVIVEIIFENGTPRLEIPDIEVDPNFPNITDPNHVSPPLNCASPPPVVDLASFTSSVEGEGVVLTWEAAGEHNNAGFNLYRALSLHGPYTRINDSLIAAKGSPIVGATYQFLDSPGPGRFFYKLEHVSRDGVAAQYSAIEVSVGTPVYLPLVMQRP